MTQFDRADPTPVDAVSLERLFAGGWPGIEQEWHGDWLLRAGHGFTGRANSALVLGRPGSSVSPAIEDVQRWYAARGLPARFQVPTGAVGPAIEDIDAELAERGWRPHEDVVVLVAEAGAVRALLPRPADDLEVAVAERPGPTWLSLYEYRGNPLPPSAIEVLSAGTAPFFVTLLDGHDAVAVARGCVTEEWLGITAVTVPARFRRRGFGTEVLRAAIGHAEGLAVTGVYLQVSRDNAGALALYGGLGFVEHHGYHYRDAPGDRT